LGRRSWVRLEQFVARRKLREELFIRVQLLDVVRDVIFECLLKEQKLKLTTFRRKKLFKKRKSEIRLELEA
jgi:hypothetical protein